MHVKFKGPNPLNINLSDDFLILNLQFFSLCVKQNQNFGLKFYFYTKNTRVRSFSQKI
jgi:hypothetical protein